MRPAALLLAALLAAGCDDGFDPFVEDDPRPFALYGLLDARRDTQFVRVQPLRTGEAPPARFTSTDLASGEAVAWRDSLVRLEDGAEGLLFFAPFRAEAGRAYRLEAAPPEGLPSAVTVPMPAMPAVAEFPPVSLNGAVSQRLVLLGLERGPLESAVVYRGRHAETGATATVEVRYGSVRVADGQRITVDLQQDAARLRFALGVEPGDSTTAALLDVRLRFALAASTGAVENGEGEVLAVSAFERPWTLPDSTLRALGLADAQGEG